MPYNTKSAQLCPIIVYDEKTMINDWKDVKKCQAIEARIPLVQEHTISICCRLRGVVITIHIHITLFDL